MHPRWSMNPAPRASSTEPPHLWPALYAFTNTTPRRWNQVQSDGLAGEKALVAILRGVVPERALGVARVLYAVGFRTIEVPLNSPDPFASIAALAAGLPPDCLVGAGTVLNAGEVGLTHAAGGGRILSANFDAGGIGGRPPRAVAVLPG